MPYLLELIMKIRNISPIHFILLTIILLFSGCTLFKSTPDRTRLFDIGFRAEKSVASSIDSAKIRLVLNHFPEYLDGPQIITKIGEHELKNNPRYRWATPLSENLLHIVRLSIQQNFPRIRIYEFPKDVSYKIDFTLRLDIDMLEIHEMTQEITFTGTWTFLNEKHEWVNHSRFEFHEQFSDELDRYAEIVAKIEQVMLKLGQALVGQIDLILLKNQPSPIIPPNN
jgi:uncharacterized lipoprotein YmbA